MDEYDRTEGAFRAWHLQLLAAEAAAKGFKEDAKAMTDGADALLLCLGESLGPEVWYEKSPAKRDVVKVETL